jgi:hypothetical protein
LTDENPKPKPVPPAKLSGFNAYWVKDYNHVISWGVIFGVVFLLYVITHIALKERYQHSKDVQNSIKASLLMYQVRVDNKTHLKKMTYEGQLIDLDDLQAGALSIGKLASGRGLIFDAVTRVENYNYELENLLVDIASGFTPVINQLGYYYIPLKTLGVNSKVLGDSPADHYVLRVNAGDRPPVEYIEGNQLGLKRLKRLLANGIVYNTNQRQSVAGETTKLKIISNEMMSPETKEAIDTINKKAGDPVLEMGYKQVLGLSANDVMKDVELRLDEIEHMTDSYFSHCKGIDSEKKSHKKTQNKDTNAASGHVAEGTTHINNLEENNFYCNLEDVLNSEVGFFWSFGSWLWVEIIWMTMLGVMTEGVIRLGAQYTGRDPDISNWDPRESARTVLKLFSASIISMVVIWTLMFTNLVKTDSGIEEGGIGVFVPLAFMLGLFPNLGYSLLKRLAEAIFTNTSVVKPKKSVQSRQVSVSSSQRVVPGEPPDFNAFKRKAIEHGSSIIKK